MTEGDLRSAPLLFFFLFLFPIAGGYGAHSSDTTAVSPSLDRKHAEDDAGAPDPGFTMASTGGGADSVPVARIVAEGRRTVEVFFGKPYRAAFTVFVFPSRTALDEHWRKAWKVPDLQTECWMVGSGIASELDLLAPSAWKADACEHDPDDAREVSLLLTHELVHVFHGQRNPRPDFEGMDAIGWFVEGLAVYASGQLDSLRSMDAAKALAEKAWPRDLETVWSGKYRYGLAGSLIRYIDQTYGRKVLHRMLAGTSERELLGYLDVTEAELLTGWRETVPHH